MNRFCITAPTVSDASKSPARLLMSIALAALLAIPGWTQRGGGRAGVPRSGAGGPAAAAGRSAIGAGPTGTGRFSSTAPSRPSASRGFSHRPSTWPDHSHGSNNRLKGSWFTRNRFPDCWGYGCWAWNSPWWAYYPYWGGYDPYNDREHDYDSAESMDRERLEDAQMEPPWAGYGYPYPYVPPRPAAPEHPDPPAIR